MLKMMIHLEVSVPSDGLEVNQTVALFQQIQEQLGPALAAQYLEEVQDQILNRVLGPKWADTPQEEAPWACPDCGSTHGFTRRGSRERVLRKTSLGRIAFNLRQVTCWDCDCTFSPFVDWFGLEPYQVSTTEFQAKAVGVACQTSYARCAEHMRNLARVEISATAVHQWAQVKGDQVAFDVTQASDQAVLLDATRVCAGDKERGCSLKLGLSVRKRRWINGRPRLDVYPVCFSLNENWAETGRELEDVSPARLVFDGDEGLVGWVEEAFPHTNKQRGVWHVVRQLYWPLWRDGLNKSQAEEWMRRLGRIIYYPEHDVRHAQAELEDLISQLSEEGLCNAASYLAAAAPYVFTYREHPDGMFFDDQRLEPLAISSTSPAERQMREINRRTDVGARWSIPGVEHLISLDLVRRFDPGQWQSLWQIPERTAPEYSIVKLQVRAEAEP